MQKLMTVSILFLILASLPSNAMARSMNCKIKGSAVTGVKSIQISDTSLFINSELEIPLEKSRVRCGNFGRQIRFDGMALGFQVVLESCSSEYKLKGHLIDEVNQVAAELACHDLK